MVKKGEKMSNEAIRTLTAFGYVLLSGAGLAALRYWLRTPKSVCLLCWFMTLVFTFLYGLGF
jgi:hypothetical protein